ncbi:unnamed protein product [Heterobilharzia americana]|nr:unnamed protein product [Heterobilharzia americana]
MPVHLINSVKFPGYLNPGHRNDLSLTTDTFNSSGTLDNKECSFSNNSLKIPLVGKPNELFIRPVNQGENQAGKFLLLNHPSSQMVVAKYDQDRVPPSVVVQEVGCIRRIREPFTPDEQLETGVAVTLEQEYNRMDACIRRIIRVVKLLPYFSEVGKPAQLSLLRTNIYGLIVLYSSFFFERDIRKLRYPVLQSDGQLTTVTVSMLDEVATPSATMNESDDAIPDSYSKILHNNTNIRSVSRCRSNQVNYAIGLREEFELYKSNTLAAFDHLDELVGSDDILRMSVLAIKLFSDNSLTEDLRAPVCAARQAYSLFLWNYIRWQAGSKRLRSATELYARILIAFIDLRTLEIRMTEFAKLLSLDGLSPLMREVCSQRSTLG